MYGFAKGLILPPASLLILAILGLFWKGAGAGWARRIAAAALVTLYALATPLVSSGLMLGLETAPPLPAQGPLPAADAIVILSAEVRHHLEYAAPSPGPLTLERLRYGARLQRRSTLPVLVTGGAFPGQPVSLASMMRQVLTEEFQVPVAWIEDQAQDTHENAARSAAILKAQGIQRIFLVTHGWHMPRARLAFERAGLTVIPAPTAVPARNGPLKQAVEHYLPTAAALQDSYFALHETCGYVFYWLAYR